MPNLWQRILHSFSRVRSIRKSKNRRKLRIENLENRALMAIDLAVITGTAFDDLTGNGLTGDDTLVSGATVELYRDDGDNVFDVGDTLLGTTTTNGSGVYRFASTNAGGTLAAGTLSADDYIIRQLAIGAFSPPAAQLVTVSAANVGGTTVQTVDTFSTTAQNAQANTGTPVVTSVIAATEAIGGERDILLNFAAGTGNLDVNVDQGDSNLLTFASGTAVDGTALIQYDGADGDANTLAATGLGAINFSAGDTLAGLQVSTRGDSAGATAEITIYTNATDFSTATVNIPDQVTLEDFFVPFSAFTVAGGAGATFTSVGAVEVLIDGVVELDAVISVVRSLRPSNVTTNLENNTPSIQVVKSTNGQDANTTTGPLLAVGSIATFTYQVTSTGGSSLQNVVLTDDNGTPGNTADDFTVNLTSGDTNANNILEITETWNYSATRTVTAGQYTNIATVAAEDLVGTDVTDTDPSNHFGVTAAINVVKSTNGQDANTTTGPLLAVGSTATFTYVVTNTGNVALATVTVRDDNGTAGNTADDFNATFVSGDTNANNRLDLTETWTYQATRVVTAGQYTNIATSTGNPVDGTGTDIAGITDPTDTDPSNHFGASANITVVKSVNGQDANTTTGPTLGVGTTATFTYVVTTSGNVPLGTVTVRDDNGTAGNTADDFNATFVSGDTNSNGRLDTTETWTYQATRTVVAGQYSNIATATGNPVDTSGVDITALQDVTDTDPANYFGVTAAINVQKLVNGQDANTAPGPTLLVGDTATFTYVVTNTGTTPLATVAVTDNNGTVGTTADDFAATFVSGDTNSNSRLDTSETWNYQATRTVISGAYSNIGTATANPVDSTGADLTGLADVTDTDPANYLGVTTGINVVKSTNGQDANTGTGPFLAVGATATFTYVVTNTGSLALGTVTLRDDNGTTGTTADDLTPTLQSGDTNSNGRLDLTETWNYQATRVVTAGQYSNIGSITANPVDGTGADIAGLADVTDTDPSNHFGASTGINVVKSTNGQDANTAPGENLVVGTTATFTYVVTNTGNSPLATVVVRDDNGTTANTADDFNATLLSGDTNSDGRLDTTETWTYQATRVVTRGLYTNTATASGNPVDTTGADIAGLTDPTDTDVSNHTGIDVFSKRRFLASSI